MVDDFLVESLPQEDGSYISVSVRNQQKDYGDYDNYTPDALSRTGQTLPTMMMPDGSSRLEASSSLSSLLAQGEQILSQPDSTPVTTDNNG
ncbi:hypothetical protein [Capybara microvirus Cap3_SP_394]|nr:hypothetical protein [Capybara microvirus Cap3_SP_394]